MTEYSKRDYVKKARSERNKQLSEEAKQKTAKRAHDWRILNQEKLMAYDKKRYNENKHVYIQRVAKRKAAQLLATPLWASTEIINAIYKKAKQMTVDTGVQHHVDHIIPLKSKVVCGLHVESNLQILTAKQNRSKSNIFNV